MKLSNKILRSVIFKHKLKFSTYNTVNMGIRAYSKLLVNRQMNKPYSLYIQNQQTIEQFKQKLSKIYPQRQFVISVNRQLLKIGDQANINDKQQNYEQFKDVPIMDALILNRFNVYEKSSSGKIDVRYGISILQYNSTNKINIPQHIQQGINQLNKQWSQKSNASIQDAISLNTIQPFNYQDLSKSQGHPNLTSQQLKSFNQSLVQLIRLEQFNKLQGLRLKPSSKLMTQLLTIMSFQWVFLFAVTYGKYGWDVGQPLSYLSSLGVDLMAMMGIFQMQKALQQKLKNDHLIMSSIMNFPSMYKMCQWRVGYFRRKIAP